MERLLRWSGFTVHTPAPLAEATDYLRRHHPRFVLLDAALPDGEGLHVLPRACDCGATVIVITGSVDREKFDHYRAAGASMVLPKPIHPEQLIAYLRNAEHTP